MLQTLNIVIYAVVLPYYWGFSQYSCYYLPLSNLVLRLETYMQLNCLIMQRN